LIANGIWKLSNKDFVFICIKNNWIRMLSSNYNKHKFTFTGFIVDAKASLIIKNGQEKRIEAKVMSLLVLLASNAGEVVTRKEILAGVWPDVIVGEEIIAQIIYSLRNALGDDAKRPKYIETIPKKGYRFIAEVSLFEENPVESITVQVQKTSKASKQVLITCCFIAITILLVWLYTEKEQSTYAINNILPVTQMLGKEGDFALHKKHHDIAYVYHDGNQADLYLRNLENNQQQQITNDDWREFSPLWLDKETLIYIRQKNNIFQIVRRHQQQSDNILYESNSHLMHLTVNNISQKDIIFIEYEHYKNGRLTALKSLNLINGDVQNLHNRYAQLPAEIHLPVYSADGTTLYFVNNNNKNITIHALNLLSKEVIQLTDEFDVIAHMSLAKPDQLLVSGTRSATNGIWQLNIANNSIQLLLPTSNSQKITKANLAGQKNEIYYATIKRSYDQVLANIKTQTFNQLPKLNSDADEFTAVFSQDDRIIYFVSNRTGYFELWSYQIASGRLQQITHLNASMIARPVISPSGKMLAVVYKTDDLTLAVISVATGKLLSKTVIPYIKHPLSFSQDEQVIYVSERRGQVDIYEYDRVSLNSTLVQEKAGLFIHESINNQSVMLMDYQYQGIIKRDLVSGNITPLTNAIKNISHLVPGQLRIVDDTILAMNNNESLPQLYQYPLTAGAELKTNQENLLLTLPEGAWLNDINYSGDQVMFTPEGAWLTDISHSGNQVIFTRNVQSQGNIMKVILSQ